MAELRFSGRLGSRKLVIAVNQILHVPARLTVGPDRPGRRVHRNLLARCRNAQIFSLNGTRAINGNVPGIVGYRNSLRVIDEQLGKKFVPFFFCAP